MCVVKGTLLRVREEAKSSCTTAECMEGAVSTLLEMTEIDDVSTVMYVSADCYCCNQQYCLCFEQNENHLLKDPYLVLHMC